MEVDSLSSKYLVYDCSKF